MTGFGRILSDLNRAGVRYVLVGGIALIRRPQDLGELKAAHGELPDTRLDERG